MQINTTLSEIQGLATNSKVYAKGKLMSQNANVESLRYSIKEHCLIADVSDDSDEGKEHHIVQVSLSQRERPRKITCDCKAAKTYLGCCTHMVATLISSLNKRIESLDVWEGPLPADPIKNPSKRRHPEEGESIVKSAEEGNSALPAPGQVTPAKPKNKAKPKATTEAEIYDKAGLSASSLMNKILVSSALHGKLEEFQLSLDLANMPITDFTPQLDLDDESDEDDENVASTPAVQKAKTGETDSKENAEEYKLHFQVQIQLPRLSAEVAQLTCKLYYSDESPAYRIKDLSAFVQSLSQARTIALSDDYELDFSTANFEPSSVKLLLWMLDRNNLSFEKTPDAYLAQNSSFDSKVILLSPQRLWNFFLEFTDSEMEALGLQLLWGQSNRPFNVSLNDSIPPLSLRCMKKKKGRSSSLAFYLVSTRKNEEEKIYVYSPQSRKSQEGVNDLRLLTRDARLLLFKKKLYRLDRATSLALRLIFIELGLSSDSSLTYSQKDGKRFLKFIQAYLRTFPLLVADNIEV